jgi:glycerophosphoryl diester phosphodiesterase
MTFIIGHRGVPWEAPENTLASLRLALERGLDGFEYDLQATQDGEPILLHDETLERTTDARGPVRERTMTELFGLDAGSWFGPAFMGEPVPAFEEAWMLDGAPGPAPLHMIEIKDASLLPAVAQVVLRDDEADQGRAAERPFVIISFHKEVCIAARDRGLPVMYLAEVATKKALQFVRDERIGAFGCGPGGWVAPDAVAITEWSCACWTWSLDEPTEMLWALRVPLAGFNTNEPDRALNLRRMLSWAPDYAGPPPVFVMPALVSGAGLIQEPVESEALANPAKSVLEPWTAAWCGDWSIGFQLSNPLSESAEVRLEPVARGGAFEFHDVPETIALPPNGTYTGSFRLVGGSRSPGPDPRLFAHFTWGARRLSFDDTIARIREARLHEGATRLSMLRESPGEPAASIVVSRRGRDLVFRIENSGGLDDASLVLRLGPERFDGGRHLAVQLRRPHFDAALDRGLAFNVGMTGTRRGVGRFYRFAGGLPFGLFSGHAGRLHLV